MSCRRISITRTRRNSSFFANLESKFLTRGSGSSVLLVFIASNAILFWYGYLLERREHTNFQRWATAIARGTGYMLNLDVGLLLLLGSRVLMGHLRNSILNLLIPFDQAMPKAHIVVGYVSFAAALTHGTFHFVPGVVANSWSGGFLGWTYCVTTGFTLISVFTILIIFARKSVRMKKFELFYYVHLATAAMFFGILFFHGVLFGKLYTWKWTIGPVVVYLIDRGYRMATEKSGSFDVLEEGVAVVTGDILRVRVRRDFEFRAGQWAELCIPAISGRQYHPFTIASSPHAEYLTFFIKSRGQGSWTAELVRMVQSGQRIGGDQFIEYRMRGPYGAPAQHAGQYEKVVLVSAGVGGTPFLSQIINFVAHVEASRVHALVGSATVDVDSDVGFLRYESNSLSSTRATPRQETASRLDSIGEAAPSIAIARTPGRLSISDRDDRSTLASDDRELTAFTQKETGPTVPSVLGSATVSFLVLYLSMFRFFLFLVGTIYDSVPGSKAEPLTGSLIGFLGYGGLSRGFRITDMCLVTLIFFTTLATIAAELWQSFEEVPLQHRIVDVILVIPTLALPLAFHVAAFSCNNECVGKIPEIVVYGSWILSAFVILYRHVRSGRPHTVLANSSRSKYHATRSLDFIYTTPTSEDDKWLIQELGCLVNSPHFRLHRFLTRERPDEEDPGKHAVGRFEANYGRPDWDDVMEKLLSNCESGSNIGVFFCGPEGMEVELRRAALAAMERSRRRRDYSGPATHGDNIGLLVRAENF